MSTMLVPSLMVVVAPEARASAMKGSTKCGVHLGYLATLVAGKATGGVHRHYGVLGAPDGLEPQFLGLAGHKSRVHIVGRYGHIDADAHVLILLAGYTNSSVTVGQQAGKTQLPRLNVSLATARLAPAIRTDVPSLQWPCPCCRAKSSKPLRRTMFRVFQPQRKILPTVPPQSALSLHPTSLNLGHPCLTRHPQVVPETGPCETNETQSSYEILRRSYGPCLTQRPNRIWRRHSAETPMKHLISTIPPDPLGRPCLFFQRGPNASRLQS